jgi:hypothetical protein
MSAHLNPILSPSDLDLVGLKYHLAPYWLEEIALLIGDGASDAEILTELQTPDAGDHTTARTIPLTVEQCNTLFSEVRELVM